MHVCELKTESWCVCELKTESWCVCEQKAYVDSYALTRVSNGFMDLSLLFYIELKTGAENL